MLHNLIRHSIILQMELVSMVAEEVQQRAEAYVQKNSDEAYEAFLNQMIANLEKTVDLVALPIENLGELFNKLNPVAQDSENFPASPINWTDAKQELQKRIQDLKKNLQA